MMTNAAANDTTEMTTIARGTTYQSATWRAHRYDTHIELVDLRNAGRRGKMCSRFFVSNPGYGTRGENLDPVAPSVLFAVNSDVAVETMARILADVGQLGLELRRTEEKGCDVDREPALCLESENVRGTFTMREFYVTFTTTHARKTTPERRTELAFEALEDGRLHESLPAIMETTFRHDTTVHGASRKDAAKAYAWAQEHLAEVVRMDRNTFIRTMDAIGVKVR